MASWGSDESCASLSRSFMVVRIGTYFWFWYICLPALLSFLTRMCPLTRVLLIRNCEITVDASTSANTWGITRTPLAIHRLHTWITVFVFAWPASAPGLQSSSNLAQQCGKLAMAIGEPVTTLLDYLTIHKCRGRVPPLKTLWFRSSTGSSNPGESEYRVLSRAPV